MNSNSFFLMLFFMYKTVLSEITSFCQVGQYFYDDPAQIQNSSCVQCQQQCQSCINNVQCTQCKGLRIDGSDQNCTGWINSCPEGYYPNIPNMRCLKCYIPFCKICSSSEECTSCFDNFTLTSSKKCVYKDFYDSQKQKVIETEKFAIEIQPNEQNTYQIVSSCPHSSITDYLNRICKKLEECTQSKFNPIICLKQDIQQLYQINENLSENQSFLIVTQSEAILLNAEDLRETSFITQLQQQGDSSTQMDNQIQDSFVHRNVLYLITKKTVLLYNAQNGFFMKQIPIPDNVQDYYVSCKSIIDSQKNLVSQFCVDKDTTSQFVLNIYKIGEKQQLYSIEFIKKIVLHKSKIKVSQVLYVDFDPSNIQIYSNTLINVIQIIVQLESIHNQIQQILSQSNDINLFQADQYIKYNQVESPFQGFYFTNDKLLYQQNSNQIIYASNIIFASFIIQFDANDLSTTSQQIIQNPNENYSESVRFTKFYQDNQYQYLILTSNIDYTVSFIQGDNIFSQSSNDAFFGGVQNYQLDSSYNSIFSFIQWSFIKASNSDNSKKMYLIGYYNSQILLFDIDNIDPVSNLAIKVLTIDSHKGIWGGISSSFRMISQNDSIIGFEKQSIWQLYSLKKNDDSSIEYKLSWNQNLYCQDTLQDMLELKDSAIQIIEKQDKSDNIIIQVQYYTYEISSFEGFSVSLINISTEKLINYSFISYNKAQVFNFPDKRYIYLTKYQIRDVIIENQYPFICIVFEKDLFVLQKRTLKIVDRLSYSSFVQISNVYQRVLFLIVNSVNDKYNYQIVELKQGKLQILPFFSFVFNGILQQQSDRTIQYKQSAYFFQIQYLDKQIQNKINDRFVTVIKDPKNDKWSIEFYQNEVKLVSFSIIEATFDWIDGDFLDEENFVYMKESKIINCKFIKLDGKQDIETTIEFTSYSNLSDLSKSTLYSQILAEIRIAVWTKQSSKEFIVFDFNSGQVVQTISPILSTKPENDQLFMVYVNSSENSEILYFCYEAQLNIASRQQYFYIYQFDKQSRKFILYMYTGKQAEDFYKLDTSKRFELNNYFETQRSSSNQRIYFYDSKNINNFYFFNLGESSSNDNFQRSYYISKVYNDKEEIKRVFFQFDSKMYSIRRLYDSNIDTNPTPISNLIPNNSKKFYSMIILENFPLLIIRTTTATSTHLIQIVTQDTFKPLYLNNNWPKYITSSVNDQIFWSDTFESFIIYANLTFTVYKPFTGFNLAHQLALASSYKTQGKKILTYQPYIIINTKGFYNYLTNKFYTITTSFVFSGAGATQKYFLENTKFLIVGTSADLNCYDISYIKYSNLNQDTQNQKSEDPSFIPFLLSKTNLQQRFYVTNWLTMYLSKDFDQAIIVDASLITTLWVKIPSIQSVQIFTNQFAYYNPQTNILIFSINKQFIGYVITTNLLRASEQNQKTSSQQQEGSMNQVFKIQVDDDWIYDTFSNDYLILQRPVYIFDNIQARQYLLINTQTGESKQIETIRSNTSVMVQYVWAENDIFITGDPSIISFGDISFYLQLDNISIYGISKNFNFIFTVSSDLTSISHIDASDLLPINKIRSSVVNNQLVVNKYVYYKQTAIYFIFPTIFTQISEDNMIQQNLKEENNTQQILFKFESMSNQQQKQTEFLSYKLYSLNTEQQLCALINSCQLTIIQPSNKQGSIFDSKNQEIPLKYLQISLLESECNIIYSKNHQQQNDQYNIPAQTGNSYFFHIKNNQKLQCIIAKFDNINKKMIVEDLFVSDLQNDLSYISIIEVFSSGQYSDNINLIPTNQFVLIKKTMNIPQNNLLGITQKTTFTLLKLNSNLQIVKNFDFNDLQISNNLFFSFGNQVYLIIGTVSSTIRVYALTVELSPILASPEILLDFGKVKLILYVQNDNQNSEYVRLIVMSRNRIYLLKGNKLLQTDTYMNNFKLIPNSEMLTHTRYNIKGEMINSNILALYNYNQIRLFKIGESIIQLIGRINEKYFKYISQVRSSNNNKIIFVIDQESIYAYSLTYQLSVTSSWISLSNNRLVLIKKFQNLVLPKIFEIKNYVPKSDSSQNTNQEMHKIYGVSAKGLFELVLNSHDFSENNSKISMISYDSYVETTYKQCQNNVQNNLQELWKQRQLYQNILDINNIVQGSFYTVKVSQNNQKLYLPTFMENAILNNSSFLEKDLTLQIDLQGNTIEFTQTNDIIHKSIIANIQISHGTIYFKDNQQLIFDTFNSLILKDITFYFDYNFDNSEIVFKNPLVFRNSNNILFDEIKINNSKIILSKKISDYQSLFSFNNVTSININQLQLQSTDIININLLNFESCKQISITSISIQNIRLSNTFANFIQNNQNIRISDFTAQNSEINQAFIVQVSLSFELKGMKLEGITQFKPSQQRILDDDQIEINNQSKLKKQRQLNIQNMENYINDFFEKQDETQYENKQEIVFVKLNFVQGFTRLENVNIKSSTFINFFNLKRTITFKSSQVTDMQTNNRILQQSNKQIIQQNMISNDSDLILQGINLNKVIFEQYFLFVNDNKIMVSNISIIESTNPSILFQNANKLLSNQNYKQDQFSNNNQDSGIIIEQLTTQSNTYSLLPILSIQNSILNFKTSKMIQNTINNNLIYAIDIEKTQIKFNDITVLSNKCDSYSIKISNCDENSEIQKSNLQSSINTISILTINNQERGGMYLLNIKNVEIIDSNFQNNSGALKGGALKLQNILLTTIKNSQFLNNKAIHSGGAIYIQDSDIILKENNKIENNYAYVGGGIRYNNTQIYPSFLKNKEQLKKMVSGNKAEIFADNYGSFFNQIKVHPLENITSSLNQKQVNLTFELFGEDGELVKLNNFNQLLLNQQSNLLIDQFYEGFLQSIYFTIKQSDDQKITIYTLNNVSSIVEGKYQLQFTVNLLESIHSTRESSITIFSASSYYIPNNIENKIVYKKISNVLPLKFRDCIQGEVIKYINNEFYYCFECDLNTYSLTQPNMQQMDDQNSASFCKECPQGVKLCSGNKIQPLEGYWIDPGTDFVQLCANNQEKCTQTNSKLGCSEGSVGPFCESCDYNHKVWNETQYQQKAYVKKNRYDCSICEDVEYTFNQYTIPLIASIIFILYLIFRIKKEHILKIDKLKVMYVNKAELIVVSNTLYETEKSTILIKFFVGHLQLLSLISIFHIPMPQSLQTGIFFMGNVLESTYYSVDCPLIKSGYSESIPMAYLRLIWNSILVPSLYIVSLLLFFGYLHLQNKRKGKGKQVQRLRNLIISGLLKLYYMIYPSIVTQTVSTISCRYINNVPYLVSDVQYLCYDDDYYLFNFTVSIPLLLLIIILPLFILRKLYHAKDKLNKIGFYLNYSFYFQEYNNQCYYWEFIKIYLKIILFLFLNIFKEYPIIFGVLFSIVIVSYIRYQQRIKPYRYQLFNYLDNLSLTACFFTIQLYIISSLDYKIFKSDLPIKIVCLIFIILINVYLLFQFFKTIIIHIFLSTRKSHLQTVMFYLSKKMPSLFKSFKYKPFNFFRQSKNWSILKKHIRSPHYKKIQEEYFTKLKISSMYSIQSKTTGNTLVSIQGAENDLKSSNTSKITAIKEENEDNSYIIENRRDSNYKLKQNKRSDIIQFSSNRLLNKVNHLNSLESSPAINTLKQSNQMSNLDLASNKQDQIIMTEGQDLLQNQSPTLFAYTEQDDDISENQTQNNFKQDSNHNVFNYMSSPRIYKQKKDENNGVSIFQTYSEQ